MTLSVIAVCTGLLLHDPNDIDLLSGLLNETDRVVVLLDGANRSRSSHLHPFTIAERTELLTLLFPDQIALGKLAFAPLDIESYSATKQTYAVNLALQSIGVDGSDPRVQAIVPVGWRKARIKRLLANLPAVREVETKRPADMWSLFLRKRHLGDYRIQPWIKEWRKSVHFAEFKADFQECHDYHRSWNRSPYPPTFNAGDAIIEDGNKILLIERKKFPFKGLAALPGGMIDPDEFLFKTALRESAEEAGLQETLLLPHFVQTRTFDEPHRDPRGRFISQTSHFRIPSATLELVAGDDAEKAWWEPIKDLHPTMFAFDHWNVVSEMLGLTWSEKGGCQREKAA